MEDMNSEIIFRKFKRKDRKAIWQMISEAWKYEEFASTKVAKKLAKVFLSSCLTNQTYTQVALADEIPVGVIMGKNNESCKCSLLYKISYAFSVFRLMLSKEGRKTSKIFSEVHDVDKRLLYEQEKKKSYQGELVFFVVSSKARGMGIGRQLFERFKNYMEESHVKRFFLFTDTSCNYGFYEHHGLKRKGEKAFAMEAGGKKAEMTFFIYEGEIR